MQPIIKCMTMFCPNCGASEQSPETYCKKCGAYLRDVSFRGWLLGSNNPGTAASTIVISSVFIAILCVCISLLIVKTLSSGDLTYLKYAFGLCWLIIGSLIPISLMGFRLWRKMRLAQSSVGESTLANNSTGVTASSEQTTRQLPVTESSGDAATELLNLPTRELDERK
jgi:hypothetical protein